MKELSPLNALKFHFYSTLVGSLVVGTILYFIRDFSSLEIARRNVQEITLVLCCIAAVISFLFARRAYNNGLMGAKEFGLTFKEKFQKYQIGMVRYAMFCEVGAMVSFIGFFVTGNGYCIIPAVIMIGCLFLKRPTRARIFNDLQLDSREQMELN